MPQRRTHVRSKNGCQTCKERHVRCDERLPYCGKCLRLGRECSYTQSIPQNSRGDIEPGVSTLLQASQQAWLTQQGPRDFQVYYIPPIQRDMPSATISIMQQSQELTMKRPMPRTCLMTIAQHYTPKYNLLAAEFDSVKYAVISFAAYMHYRVTRSPLSQQVCVQSIGTALKHLRVDIASFGSHNADAVVTASIFLAGTAQGWDEWAVFVDGYSKALSQIAHSNLPTIYPNFLTNSLQLRRFALHSNPSTPPLPCSKPLMRQRVALVLAAISTANQHFGLQKWRQSGFLQLEQLTNSVDAALAAPSESETYHQLAWLRSWHFWMDLRKGAEESDEQVLLGALFNALVLCVMPLFPTRYAEFLVAGTVAKIRKAEVVLQGREVKEGEEGFGLGKLLDAVEPIW